MRKFFTLFILPVFVFTVSVSYAQLMVETVTAPINGSGGVCVDKQGNIYVANYGIFLNTANGTQVWRVTPGGTVTLFASGLSGASGNSFGPDGFLYQSNIAGNRISKIDTAGNVTTFATVGISGPVGIAVDPDGNVFVANCGNNTIRKVTPGGISTQYASGSLLNCPNGLTMDNDRNLYTCNFGNGNVLKIDTNGQVSVLVSIPGGSAFPQGNNGHLTFANGVLYVVGRGGNQIWEVTLSGDTTLIAGTGQRGQQDGPALQSTWSVPNGIRASITGDTLYINDAVPLTGSNLNPVVVRRIIGITTSVQNTGSGIPSGYKLDQNFPNPFNPATKITFDVARTSNVSLVVYNSMGQEVRTIFDRKLSPGNYESNFNGGGLPSGVYYYTLRTDGFTDTKKMVLIK